MPSTSSPGSSPGTSANAVPVRPTTRSGATNDGHVVEDGVILRLSEDEFLLTAAEPNLAYFRDLIGHESVEITDVSDDFGALALQGPYAREILKTLAPEMEGIGYFHLTPAKVGNASVTISRTGYTGDLGYEVWVERDDALDVWDAVEEVGAPMGVIPAGQIALLISRIEAGLVLIDVDFYSSRYAWNDDQRTTPIELGMSWMLRDLETDDRAFIGRRAIERELADGTSRWRTVGIVVDWEDWNRVYNERSLVPPKDHTPEHGGMMLYDEKVRADRLHPELRVLADDAAAHRDRPGPPRALQARAPRSASRSPSTIVTTWSTPR